MTEQTSPKGYIIQLYQYASRYEYNNTQLLKHFNQRIKDSEGKSTQDEDYTALGDFDLMEINSVSSFRQYHDVSEFAKGWIGKRQCMLLYDISDMEEPVRLVYEKSEQKWESYWKSSYPLYKNASAKKFFCLSMFSLTNDVSSGFQDIHHLLREVRKKILSITDRINQELPRINLCCEVFGTFNTSEIAVIWLTDEYVDALHMLDFCKNMTVRINGNDKQIPVFMTSFSVITMRSNLSPDDQTFNMKGNALLQLSFNDENADYDTLRKIKQNIVEKCSADPNLETFDSVGEYDWAVKCSAKYLLRLICPKNEDHILHIGSRIKGDSEHTPGYFDPDQECRAIIRNNTRLLIGNDVNQELLEKLQELNKENMFKLEVSGILLEKKKYHDYLLDQNRSFYFAKGGLRDKLKRKIKSATGTVDTMDLLVTDYQSVISSTYNRIWAEDMHCQFNAVLHAIDELIDKVDADLFWESYRDIANSFKQQITHLTQSNRLFFEIPGSHLRATGHYDFLMHAYYGITKKIIEAVYLMQEKDAQSDLVPLMTINTVPQVESELFFNFEKDTVRTMNLIIPNSVLTDPYRGIIYLCHEMFHYAVPQDRRKRNYLLGVFFLCSVMSTQMLLIMKGILKTGCPTELLNKVEGFLDFKEREEGNAGAMISLLYPSAPEIPAYYTELKTYIQDREYYSLFEKATFEGSDEKSNIALKSSYLDYLEEFASTNASDELFNHIFPLIFNGFRKRFEVGKNQVLLSNPDLKDVIEWIGSRFTYFRTQEEMALDRKGRDGGCYSQLLREAAQFREAFLMRNRDADQDFPYLRQARSLTKAIDEAHSDIAAVTLAGIRMPDYILFFIRNIIELDRQEVMNFNDFEEGSILRFSLVINYCKWKHIDSYGSFSTDERGEILEGEDLAYFRKAFSWIFISDKSEVLRKHDVNTFEKYLKLADQWISHIQTMLHKFKSMYRPVLKDIFVPLLETADVYERIRTLRKSENRELINFALELNKIQSDFSATLSEYFSLFRDYPVFGDSESSARRKALDRKYRLDLMTMHRFQKQDSLIDLQNKNKKIIQTFSNINTGERDFTYLKGNFNHEHRYEPVWRFDVHNWNELQEYLKYCKYSYSKILQSWSMDDDIYKHIWYRGQTSNDESKYRLWSTMVRNIQKDIKEGRKEEDYLYHSFVRYQRTHFELFKTLVDGAPEIPLYGTFSDADYVALMQHYGVDTNLIDFTDNAFIALYLALKYYSKEDRNTRNHRDCAIYLLNPVVYNRYRRNMLLEQIELMNLSEEKKAGAMKIYGIEDDDTGFGLVPNISLGHNADLYARYILGNSQLDKQSHYELSGEKIKALPVAIWTPRLNNRIRTQSGSFVAYDLYADVMDESYTLERLQDEEISKHPEDPCIFLYKLTICESCCQDICNTLMTMGITRQFIYPEIEQVKHRF